MNENENEGKVIGEVGHKGKTAGEIHEETTGKTATGEAGVIDRARAMARTAVGRARHMAEELRERIERARERRSSQRSR